jgi:splicing factor U2AF subunit
VDERRRKRLARTSKFDQGPAVVNPTDVAAAAAAALAMAAGPQQTRHARRLYVGNLPPGILEEQIHREFQTAVKAAYVPAPPQHPPLTEDPILSVYINHERHFCFLEFKTVEMTTACMAMDGLPLAGQSLKIKRPNDYSPAMAPRVHPNALPNLDVSKLGMISGTVLDGPNKIFIGGLHYHFADAQVLELLGAFGKVKAFHLVKGNDPDGSLSKGYCFIEYADPAVTATAIAGLNGMDIGAGKSLTARLAGDRSGGMDGPASAPPAAFAVGGGAAGLPGGQRTIVHGYDIEALVDAAMGQAPMPTMPTYTDAMGMPMTIIVPLVMQQQQQQAALPPPPPVTQGPGVSSNGTAPPPAASNSRVLVLHNMVQSDDLSSAEDHQALMDEVKEECAKYGSLISLKIPRAAEAPLIAPSAVGKVFLEYATPADAATATVELHGRQFGEAAVEVTNYDERDFAAGTLR